MRSSLRRCNSSPSCDGVTPAATSMTVSGWVRGGPRHGPGSMGNGLAGAVTTRTGWKETSKTTQAAHSAVVTSRSRNMRAKPATLRPGPAVAAVRSVTWRRGGRRCQAGSAHRRRVSLLHLLREIVLLADLADQLELGLEPVCVLLLADEDPGEEILAGVVARLAGRLDTLVEKRDRGVLELEVALELFLDGLADAQLVIALQIGHSLEEQDAADHLVGVAHLVDRFLANLVRQAFEPPVFTHLRVHEVLVDRRELVGEQVVEEREHLFVALHDASLRPAARWTSDSTLTTRDRRHNRADNHLRPG